MMSADDEPASLSRDTSQPRSFSRGDLVRFLIEFLVATILEATLHNPLVTGTALAIIVWELLRLFGNHLTLRLAAAVAILGSSLVVLAPGSIPGPCAPGFPPPHGPDGWITVVVVDLPGERPGGYGAEAALASALLTELRDFDTFWVTNGKGAVGSSEEAQARGRTCEIEILIWGVERDGQIYWSLELVGSGRTLQLPPVLAGTPAEMHNDASSSIVPYVLLAGAHVRLDEYDVEGAFELYIASHQLQNGLPTFRPLQADFTAELTRVDELAALPMPSGGSPSLAAPLMGDWDGDGIATLGTYEPAPGLLRLFDSNRDGSPATVVVAVPGAIPLVADFDGDGTDAVSFYQPSEGAVYVADDAGPDAGFRPVRWASSDARPYVADVDGDGADDLWLRYASGVHVAIDVGEEAAGPRPR